MNNNVIEVRRVSKLYQLGARRERYRTLRDTIAEGFASLFRAKGAVTPELLWALRNVSFDVKRGEVVGVIGRNGAGKSTLLKMLSEITYPTEGRVEIHGRVGSLLEVGTGFHPELTGRENIFLNGAILGMKRAEIRRKFDEIVAFAEVDKFIDTPVKRYSSGMYVRLAFAVAAHLEPEILLVDEVLAVGDAQFQKKCLGKMNDVAKTEGRTIIFVSHNMAAIEVLCDRCLLLQAGRLAGDGPTDSVIAQYQMLMSTSMAETIDLTSHPGRRKNSIQMMKRASLLSTSGKSVTSIRMGDGLAVRVDFSFTGKPVRPVLGLALKTFLGSRVFSVDNRFVGGFNFNEALQEGTITCYFDRLPLLAGKYMIDLYFGDEQQSLDAVFDAIQFEVDPKDVFGSGKLPPPGFGPFFWPASWSLNRRDGSSVQPQDA